MKKHKLYHVVLISIRSLFHPIPFSLFRWRYNVMVRRAFNAGPPYQPSHKRIIIDITERCNLGCRDCCRSCGSSQAPSKGMMSLTQIDKFIQESREKDRRWEKIQIEGGEPTLHPQFLEIIDRLINHNRTHSPETLIQVNTNGYASESRRLMNQLPAEVQVYSSVKTSTRQREHLPFNMAPIDDGLEIGYDFSQGCYLSALYGLGLTRFGYYPHPNCGGIDRVFGFGMGRKNLPPPDDDFHDHFSVLCGYCGLFPYFNKAASKKHPPRYGTRGSMSKSWVRAYDLFSRKRGTLVEY